jgi:hypothetical protein
MKPILFSLGCLVVFTLEGYGQNQNSQQLYWVIETNIHYRDCTIVRFYTQKDDQVYELKLMGVSIDVQKPKQKKKLDQLLNVLSSRIITTSEWSDPKVYELFFNNSFIRKRQVLVQLQQIDRGLL